jgi:hypothetical protein
MSDYDDEKRGQNAENLLKDALLAKALKVSRETILSAWEQTPIRDAEGREFLWKLHQASLRFEEILRGWIQNGEIAKANLKEGKSVTQRIRSAF